MDKNIVFPISYSVQEPVQCSLLHWCEPSLFTELIILIRSGINMWIRLGVLITSPATDNFKVVSLSYFNSQCSVKVGVIKYCYFGIIIMIYSVL